MTEYYRIALFDSERSIVVQPYLVSPITGYDYWYETDRRNGTAFDTLEEAEAFLEKVGPLTGSRK